jgi:hypothetical protein
MSDPSLHFCNAFWGQGSRGYEVIMARLRGASRTVDELRGYWKERWVTTCCPRSRATMLTALPVPLSRRSTHVACQSSPSCRLAKMRSETWRHRCSLSRMRRSSRRLTTSS